MICGCRTVGVRGLSHHGQNTLMHMLIEHLWTCLGDGGGGRRSLGVYIYCQTWSPGLSQDRWQMSCLEVTGDPTGSSFMPHSVSQDATLSPADTLVYTFTSKEGPAGCSHSRLDGNKQSLTKEEKTQTLWASSWQRRSVVDIFFFLKKSCGCVFKIVSPLGHISCLIAESFPPLLLLPASCIGCSIIIIATAERKQEEPDVWHQMELSSNSPSIMV